MKKITTTALVALTGLCLLTGCNAADIFNGSIQGQELKEKLQELGSSELFDDFRQEPVTQEVPEGAKGNQEDTAYGTRIFYLDDYGFQINADTNWRLAATENLDMQIYNDREYLQMSLFCYGETELPSDMSAEDLFWIQTNDILDKRSNVQVIDSFQTAEHQVGTMYSARYSAIHEENENEYAFYLINFAKTKEKMWIIVNAEPEDFQENMVEIEQLIRSISIKK